MKDVLIFDLSSFENLDYPTFERFGNFLLRNIFKYKKSLIF